MSLADQFKGKSDEQIVRGLRKKMLMNGNVEVTDYLKTLRKCFVFCIW